MKLRNFHYFLMVASLCLSHGEPKSGKVVWRQRDYEVENGLIEGYKCHDNNGYGTQNDDGLQILNLAESCNLIIANSFFKKKGNYLITYISGGNTS